MIRSNFESGKRIGQIPFSFNSEDIGDGYHCPVIIIDQDLFYRGGRHVKCCLANLGFGLGVGAKRHIVEIISICSADLIIFF